MLRKETACIICFRLFSGLDGNSDSQSMDDPTQEGELLTRFFRVLDRHPDNWMISSQEPLESTRFPFEQLVKARILACEDCSKLVESFCDHYHQMKSIQLLLNWRLRSLKDIMLCAQRSPERIAKFQANVEQLGIEDIGGGDIIDYKQDLIKKCFRILSSASPHVTLAKLPKKEVIVPDQEERNEKSSPTGTTETEMEQPRGLFNDLPQEDSDNKGEDRSVVLSSIKSNNDNENISNSVSLGPSSKFKCSSCPMTFCLTSDLLDHYSRLHLSARFKCDLCPEQFSYRQSYTVHYRKVHLRVSKFRCRTCGKAFSRGSELRGHQQRRFGCMAKERKIMASENFNLDKNPNDSKGTVPSTPSKEIPDNLRVPDLDFTLKKKTLLGSTLLFRIRKLRPTLMSINRDANSVGRSQFSDLTKLCRNSPQVRIRRLSQSQLSAVKAKGILRPLENLSGPNNEVLPINVEANPNVTRAKVTEADCFDEGYMDFDKENIEQSQSSTIAGDNKGDVDAELRLPSGNGRRVPKPTRQTGKKKGIIKPVSCSVCQKLFSSKNTLTAHYNSVHRQIRYRCKLCQKDFHYRASFALHHKTVHGGGSKFECLKCHKIFPRKSTLRKHSGTCHKITTETSTVKEGRYVKRHLSRVHPGNRKNLV